MIKQLDVALPYANALRRIICSQIRTLAIYSVDIYVNDAYETQTDEAVALCMGQLPISGDPFSLPLECKCRSYCEECSFKFSIEHKDGPVDTTHFVKLDTNKHLPAWKDVRFVVELDRPYQFLKLKKDQNFKAVAWVKAGTASMHAKWSPVWKPLVIPNDKGGYTLKYGNNGALTPQQVYDQAVDKLLEMIDELNV